jgi:uncharacterized membrane protein
VVMNVSEFVLHGVVLSADGKTLMDEWNRMGLHVSDDPKYLSVLLAITFLLGILAVWTYAAIRPRFGPGPKTAIIAGVAVWAMSYLYFGVVEYAAIQVVPAKLVWCPVVWGLVEVPVATLIGGWFYKE